MVKEPNRKPQNLPHERNNEYKIKERRNHCKQKKQKKQKKTEKETSSDQLKRQENQCSKKEIESAPSYGPLFETLDAISNNKFDKDLEKIAIINNLTTDQQPGHFLSANLSH